MLALLLSCALSSPSTVWLYSGSQPHVVRGECERSCLKVDIETFSCPPAAPAIPNLVVSGHSQPPEYLGGSASRIAAVADCFQPDLLVLDTCYGLSHDLLAAIAAVEPGVRVVGTTYKLPPAGLLYGEAFSDAGLSPEMRAAAVRTRSGKPLSMVQITPEEVSAAFDDAMSLPSTVLSERVVRLHPNLVKATLLSGSTILVRVEPEHFR